MRRRRLILAIVGLLVVIAAAAKETTTEAVRRVGRSRRFDALLLRGDKGSRPMHRPACAPVAVACGR